MSGVWLHGHSGRVFACTVVLLLLSPLSPRRPAPCKCRLILLSLSLMKWWTFVLLLLHLWSGTVCHVCNVSCSPERKGLSTHQPSLLPPGCDKQPPQPSYQPTTPTGIQKFPFFSPTLILHLFTEALPSSSPPVRSTQSGLTTLSSFDYQLYLCNIRIEKQKHNYMPHTHTHTALFSAVAKYFPKSLFLKQKGEWIFSKVWRLVSYDVSPISLVG